MHRKKVRSLWHCVLNLQQYLIKLYVYRSTSCITLNRHFEDRQTGHQEALAQLKTLTQRCEEAEKARDEMTQALASAESEKVQLYRSVPSLAE